jgi:uncharacterized protein
MITLRSFNAKAIKNKKAFKSFLGKLEKKAPGNYKRIATEINAEVWKETDCLSCSNCCRKMTPLLTNADQKRIAAHLQLTIPEFKEKYLVYDDKDKDWSMKVQPCKFLNLQTNKCNIYEVRPVDCAGFPHLTKSPIASYAHVHQQNIMYCPATYLFVEKLQERITLSK